MAYALINSTTGVGTVSSVTTGSIDTTGADLIVIGVAYNTGAPPTITDSKGNTWTPLTAKAVTSNGTSRLYYCQAPNVGTGHTFSNTGVNNFATLCVLAFSGSLATPFDVQNGATNAAASTLATGSITPSLDNELVVTHFMYSATAATPTINGGFATAIAQNFVSGNNYGGAMSYLIQTIASAANPTWSEAGGSTGIAATIASFKVSSVPTLTPINPTFKLGVKILDY